MNEKNTNISGTNEISVKKKKAPFIIMLSIIGIALSVAAYMILSPIEVVPAVAEINGISDVVIMTDDFIKIETEVLSDVDLNMVDMPETKEFMGMNFKATYDIQDFIYTVTYISSDDTVATVDAEGNVTPMKPGKAKITVSAGDISKVVEITVKEYVRPESMPDRVEVLVGESKDLLEPVGEFQILKTEFSVIDTSIINIDNNGTITALKQGETSVGTMLNNETSALTVVKVLQPVTELGVSDKTVNVGSTVKANVNILPEGADYGTTLTYSSADETIASVSEKGVITGKKAGTVRITVISEGGIENQFTVTVKKIVVQTPANTTPSNGTTGTSGGSQSSNGSVGTTTSGPTQLSDAEIAAIVAAGNAALGEKYFEGANSYGADRNVITVNKSYDQVYNEVMALVSRTYVAGRVFNIGSTIIVAYSF